MFSVVIILEVGVVVIMGTLSSKQSKKKWPEDCTDRTEIQIRLLSQEEITRPTALSPRSFATEGTRPTWPIDALVATARTPGPQIIPQLKCLFKESLQILKDSVTLS